MFLEWLIRHPDQLTWPTSKGIERTFGAATQKNRERLFGRCGTEQQRLAQEEALFALATDGPRGSERKWWAFEGFTKVDLCLQTERLVLFVEGKRTEKLTKSNDWFKSRSQLVRNLEVVRELADGRAAAVLLAVEQPLPELSPAAFGASLPHLVPAERAVVRNGYLGQRTWLSICTTLGVDYDALPDVIGHSPD